MIDYDTYIAILCLIVFVGLTLFFTVVITLVVKQQLKIIDSGLADKEIVNKRQKLSYKKYRVIHFIFKRILPILLFAIIVTSFVFSLVIKINGNNRVGDIPTLKVVTSASMAKKHENNVYLEKNNINNQLQKNDLILIYALPQEQELKLYDIVAYEVNSTLVLHRIVGIEEPNLSHSERWFKLQGDANKYADTSTVKYSQMKGIYKDKRVAKIGGFVIFLQSPIGYVCVMFMTIVCIMIYPFVEKKINRAERLRLAIIEKQLGAKTANRVELLRFTIRKRSTQGEQQ